MKLDQKTAGSQTQGLTVNLHDLNRGVAKTDEQPTQDAAALGDLLVAKLPNYQVGPQDILLVTVWDHPEITLPLGQYRTDNAAGLVVDEKGVLFFPYVGELSVRGMTVSEVRNALTAKLGLTLRNPQVDVKVVGYRSQKVFVDGEVRLPAVCNVTDVPFTLTEAVNRAGGFLPTADQSRIQIIRGERRWTLNFPELMAAGSRGGQVLLKDGDSVHVPNLQDNKVFAMGELVKPGSLALVQGRLSLAEAISDAGGIVSKTADARSIYVIRAGAAAKSVELFHLDARNPAAMVLADQFALHPRDIIYVDGGTLVRWSRVMELLMPTFTTVTGTALAAADIKYLK